MTFSSKLSSKSVCKNLSDPTAPDGCLGTPDERYTMRFDDLGQEPIYWCAVCGPEAQQVSDALEAALRDRGPEFAGELEKAIDEAEGELTAVKEIAKTLARCARSRLQ